MEYYLCLSSSLSHTILARSSHVLELDFAANHAGKKTTGSAKSSLSFRQNHAWNNTDQYAYGTYVHIMGCRKSSTPVKKCSASGRLNFALCYLIVILYSYEVLL